MIPPSEFAEWMSHRQLDVENTLAQVLPSLDTIPGGLHDAMRYAVLDGGKRVRPLLCFAAGEMVDAPKERLLKAAAAVELIHCYSLVHDDLPSMDNDTLRRGKPTCHVAHGEATALLVGDALQSLAFQILAEDDFGDPAGQLRQIAFLGKAAGSRGMAGGQAIDLESVGRELSLPELELMHIHKTGALIRAAVMMGAAAGKVLDGGEHQRLDHYAKSVGLAFQVVDDVLDVESDTATIGKTAGKDAAMNKPTYTSLLGLQGARGMAERLHDEAVESLESFGERAARLRDLAGLIVHRRY